MGWSDPILPFIFSSFSLWLISSRKVSKAGIGPTASISQAKKKNSVIVPNYFYVFYTGIYFFLILSYLQSLTLSLYTKYSGLMFLYLPFSISKKGLQRFNKATYKLIVKPSWERFRFLADYNLLLNFVLPRFPMIAA